MAASSSKSVLFVCLGNICRSPMAEAMLRQMLKQRGVLSEWTLDSAATSRYEIGNEPDDRGNDVLKEHDFERNTWHRARQITKEDYEKFHYIFGFDEDNLNNLNKRKPSSSNSVVRLLGELDPEGKRIINDPYYNEAFEQVFAQNKRCLEVFMKEVVE